MGRGGVGGGGGGGGGGSNITIGSGSAGTCFSGGAGSGGTGVVSGFSITTANAGINGGAGTPGFLNGLFSAYDLAGGAGNPGGDLSGGVFDASGGLTSDGTGGVLIVFVEGTITTQGSSVKHFTANGITGNQTTSSSGNYTGIFPFGGASGGGIVILVNNNAVSLGDNVEAKGGTYANNGPTTPYQSGGNGATYCVTFNDL